MTREDLLQELARDANEMDREKKRLKGVRLTFDCFNAIFPRNGNSRVKCRAGKMMSVGGDGCMDVEKVLAGSTGVYCYRCRKFDGG